MAQMIANELYGNVGLVSDPHKREGVRQLVRGVPRETMVQIVEDVQVIVGHHLDERQTKRRLKKAIKKRLKGHGFVAEIVIVVQLIWLIIQLWDRFSEETTR